VIQVPEIETTRLLLREWRATDLDAHAAMCADAELMQFLDGTIDRDESWRRMAVHAGHWQLRGYGNWVVQHAEGDRRMIGSVGLWYPQGWLGLEVGWKLDRSAWGHGYATEAAAATIAWAWQHLDADQLISVIHPENLRSLAVATRIGMTPLREDTAHGQPVRVMALRRPSQWCDQAFARLLVRQYASRAGSG
jgi:RimJ/RimL family protein N-acetyltransferase